MFALNRCYNDLGKYSEVSMYATCTEDESSLCMLQYNTNLTNLLNDAKHNSVLLSMHCTATIILINKISLCKLSYINGFLFLSYCKK